MTVFSLDEWLAIDGPAKSAPEVVICGAGAAGLAMAVDLARRGRRVLVFEAGPKEPPIDWMARNRGAATRRAHRGLVEGRMRAFGGTTRLWGGQLVPFDEADFYAEPHIGKPGWPIEYPEFAEWVQRAYDLLGVEPPSRDTAALWSRITGREPRLKHDIIVGMNIWLQQPDFTKIFAKYLEGSVNPQIVTDAQLRNLEFSAPGVVKSLQLRKPDAGSVVIEAPQVVLAMGTLEISRQLLAIAATRPNCGFSKNKNLGRWFIDHAHVLCGKIESQRRKQLANLFDDIYVNKRKFSVKMRASASLRRCEGIGNVAATLNVPVGPRAIAADFIGLVKRVAGGDGRKLGTAIRDGVKLGTILLPIAWRFLIKRRSASLIGRDIYLGLELEQLPNESSYVSLNPAFPPEEAPIQLHWDLGEHEMRSAQVMSAKVAEAFEEAGYGRIEIDPLLLMGNRKWLDGCHDSFHQMGGARMAGDADNGVVTADCRVFGTENLYVAGPRRVPLWQFR
jgi:hypothetical protein